jgi:hypothetical protein
MPISFLGPKIRTAVGQGQQWRRLRPPAWLDYILDTNPRSADQASRSRGRAGRYFLLAMNASRMRLLGLLGNPVLSEHENPCEETRLPTIAV